jgi:hypothetical protein
MLFFTADQMARKHGAAHPDRRLHPKHSDAIGDAPNAPLTPHLVREHPVARIEANGIAVPGESKDHGTNEFFRQGPSEESLWG